MLFRLGLLRPIPNEIFAIHNGGLAIYGGVIAGVLVIWLVCRKRRYRSARCSTCMCYGLLIGQILGRWGNFMNREAFGADCNGVLPHGADRPRRHDYLRPSDFSL